MNLFHTCSSREQWTYLTDSLQVERTSGEKKIHVRMHQCNQMLCLKHALLPWLPIQRAQGLKNKEAQRLHSVSYFESLQISHTHHYWHYFLSAISEAYLTPQEKKQPAFQYELAWLLSPEKYYSGRERKKQSYASDFWRRTRVGGGSVTEFFINTLAGLAILFTPHTLVFRPGSKAQAAVTSSIGAVVQSHWKMNSKHI